MYKYNDFKVAAAK